MWHGAVDLRDLGFGPHVCPEAGRSHTVTEAVITLIVFKVQGVARCVRAASRKKARENNSSIANKDSRDSSKPTRGTIQLLGELFVSKLCIKRSAMNMLLEEKDRLR